MDVDFDIGPELAFPIATGMQFLADRVQAGDGRISAKVQQVQVGAEGNMNGIFAVLGLNFEQGWFLHAVDSKIDPGFFVLDLCHRTLQGFPFLEFEEKAAMDFGVAIGIFCVNTAGFHAEGQGFKNGCRAAGSLQAFRADAVETAAYAGFFREFVGRPGDCRAGGVVFIGAFCRRPGFLTGNSSDQEE